MMRLHTSLAATLVPIVALTMTAMASISGFAAEPKWESLASTVDPAKQAVAGAWSKSGNELSVRAAQGACLALTTAPQGEYDLRASFTRKSGQHSIGLVVVHGNQQVVFEVDAWGSHLAGFQDVGGKSIRDNATRRADVRLENNKRYTITVEVRKGQLRGLLENREIATLPMDGATIAVPDVWKFPGRDQLGLVAWESDTSFHSVEVRSINRDPLVVARTSTPATASPTKPTPTNVPSTAPAAPASTKAAASNLNGKRVLIVVANHHFFYREYGEPRQELERAGIRVTVAAGRRGTCRPHDGSGQGQDGGIVQAELALRDVKAKDYDAILFSGGWGASAYQFAFNGRYNDQQYNGDRAIKTEVNRVINEFIEQDKYVAALCNGVSVLAWARVDGKSPLTGKRVCAPVREAPAGIYNGRPGQPSCRWHPEANGAILSPAGTIGQPGTAIDDVLVDGKIITGEDDIAAREMGRRIVQVLSR
jgi:putative intracellular protease/amidase